VSVLREVFAQRADLLRSESVLSAIERDALTRANGIGRDPARAVLRRTEAIRLSPAADELRRLHALRLACDDDVRGRLAIAESSRLELRRVLAPGEPAVRLGRPDGATAVELVQAAERGRARWTALERSSPISPALRRVAEVAAETYGELAREAGRRIVLG
jgi:hypothetical protein